MPRDLNLIITGQICHMHNSGRSFRTPVVIPQKPDGNPDSDFDHVFIIFGVWCSMEWNVYSLNFWKIGHCTSSYYLDIWNKHHPQRRDLTNLYSLTVVININLQFEHQLKRRMISHCYRGTDHHGQAIQELLEIICLHRPMIPERLHLFQLHLSSPELDSQLKL